MRCRAKAGDPVALRAAVVLERVALALLSGDGSALDGMARVDVVVPSALPDGLLSLCHAVASAGTHGRDDELRSMFERMCGVYERGADAIVAELAGWIQVYSVAMRELVPKVDYQAALAAVADSLARGRSKEAVFRAFLRGVGVPKGIAAAAPPA